MRHVTSYLDAAKLILYGKSGKKMAEKMWPRRHCASAPSPDIFADEMRR